MYGIAIWPPSPFHIECTLVRSQSDFLWKIATLTVALFGAFLCYKASRLYLASPSVSTHEDEAEKCYHDEQSRVHRVCPNSLTANLSLNDIENVGADFKKLNIVVIGDMYVDKLLFGKMQGILNEFAAPMITEQSRKHLLGAASNVAVNCSKLECGNVFMIGVVGDDDDGKWILNQLENGYNINIEYVVRDSMFETMSYSKMYALNHSNKHAPPQCLLAIDRNNEYRPEVNKRDIERRLIESVEAVVEDVDIDGIIIVDQIASAITSKLLQCINTVKLRNPDMFIVADSRSQINLFENNIEVDLMKANHHEVAAYTGIPVECDHKKSVSRNIEQLMHCSRRFVLMTCGENGLVLADKVRNECATLSLSECRCVAESKLNCDVTGCGDCVSALVSLLCARNVLLTKHGTSTRKPMDVRSIGLWCNVMGSLAFQMFGTSQISLNRLLLEMMRTQRFGGKDRERKIVREHEFGALVKYIELVRKKESGTRIVYENGYFDLLHSVHLDNLYNAKQLGDVLVVGVNVDYTSNHKKLSRVRPVNDIEERMRMLSYLDFVDFVVPFGEVDCVRHLRSLKPDIWVKGDDYNMDTLNQNERKVVESYDGQIRFIETRWPINTTKIIQTIVQRLD